MKLAGSTRVLQCFYVDKLTSVQLQQRYLQEHGVYAHHGTLHDWIRADAQAPDRLENNNEKRFGLVGSVGRWIAMAAKIRKPGLGECGVGKMKPRVDGLEERIFRSQSPTRHETCWIAPGLTLH